MIKKHFKKPNSKIELLTAKEALKRKKEAIKSFEKERKNQYRARLKKINYVENILNWSGWEASKSCEKYYYFSFFNPEDKKHTKLLEGAFHDEFKILREEIIHFLRGKKPTKEEQKKELEAQKREIEESNKPENK